MTITVEEYRDLDWEIDRVARGADFDTYTLYCNSELREVGVEQSENRYRIGSFSVTFTRSSDGSVHADATLIVEGDWSEDALATLSQDLDSRLVNCRGGALEDGENGFFVTAYRADMVGYSMPRPEGTGWNEAAGEKSPL